MARMPRSMFLMLLLLVFHIESAFADENDDFVNNLVTDLTPLIALFGEKVAMQFMSESMGLSDCIALAMAPIGIITTIVSAIRVGGPRWMKAIIGRARENLSTAEIELMSSTSKEACELWNGHNLVRCPGSGQIWQFICLVPKGEREAPGEGDFVSLEEAVTSHLLEKTDIRASYNLRTSFEHLKLLLSRKFSGPKVQQNSTENDLERGDTSSSDARHTGTWDAKGAIISNRRQHSDGKCSAKIDEAARSIETKTKNEPSRRITVVRDLDAAAPNISLNCRFKLGRAEIISVATLGTLIQIGVLVLCVMITLYPPIAPQYLKNNKPVQNYALPLTICGTVLLTIGILVCGIVVEQSSTETYFRANEDYSLYIVWLQQGSIVNDQEFKPFAIYPVRERPYIAMSRRRPAKEKKGKKNKRPKGSKLSGPNFDNFSDGKAPEQFKSNSADEVPTLGLESLTTAGCFISLVGYVLQFIGLRGMNWVAPVVQLGAMVFMTGLRAWVRRGLAEAPAIIPLTPGFELDWFAHSLSNHEIASWIKQENKPPNASESQIDGGEPTNGPAGGTVTVEVEHEEASSLRNLASATDAASISASQAEDAVMVRRELGKLADWRGPASNLAILLSDAIEVVAGDLLQPPLCKDASGSHTIGWTYETTLGNQKCNLTFSLEYKDGEWRARADELEAAMSLWLSFIQSQKHSLSDKRLDDSDGWLRIKRTRQLKLRLYGTASKKFALIRDLLCWMPENIPEILELEEASSESEKGTFERIALPNYRIVGYDMRHESVTKVGNSEGSFNVFHVTGSSAKTPLESWKEATQNGHFHTLNKRTLAVKAHDSLDKLLARDLFFTFCRSIVKHPRLEWEEKDVDLSNETMGDDWRNFKLKNGMLTKLIQRVTNTGFLDLQEAYFDVITPLSLESMLPDIGFLVRHLQGQATKCVLEGQWQNLVGQLRSIFDLALTYAVDDSLMRPRILAICQYHLELMGAMEEMAVAENRRESVVIDGKRKELQNFYRKVLENMKLTSLSTLSSVFDGQFSIWNPVSNALDLSGRFRILSDDQKRFRLSEYHLTALGVGTDSRRIPKIEGILYRDSFDWTPIHYLSALGHQVAFLRGIFAQLPKTDLRDCFGLTPLHFACARGDFGTVDVMLKQGEPISVGQDNGMSLMHLAASSGEPRIVKKLLNQAKTSDVHDSRVPYWRTGKLDTSLTEEAFYQRAPIHLAAMKGHLEIVVDLFRGDWGLKDLFGWSCFHLAVLYEHTELVRILIRAEHPDIHIPGNDNRTPLHLAVDKRNKTIIQMLLNRNVNINTMSSDGYLPFAQAVDACDEDTIQMMITNGARINVQESGPKRWSPLHYAARRGNFNILKLLLTQPDATRRAARIQDIDGNTALHIALVVNWCPNFRDFIKFLLRSMDESAINYQNMRGKTALHKAASNGKVLAAIDLLEAGATPSLSLRDETNATPLDLARERREKSRDPKSKLSRWDKLKGFEKAEDMVNVLERWQPTSTTGYSRNLLTA
ncbi:ankyrin repeat protein [Pochonia chlamydosporia 170]|uniref:Ankyrin repeat protein n=1 Tax=Pochonia chlamydosporia 170 TaxID=1380566 RepID=A0A179F4C4_METCM|nr:ankyrin repeat protein [Pochonia chlamydosporia 170]OAQ60220.2 ankyrin repeat protein [Pochonia chlamydosporia 170]